MNEMARMAEKKVWELFHTPAPNPSIDTVASCLLGESVRPEELIRKVLMEYRNLYLNAGGDDQDLLQDTRTAMDWLFANYMSN